MFLPALVLLLTSYPLLYPSFPALRQRARTLAALASFVMTSASAPYVWDYLMRGGVEGVREREWTVQVRSSYSYVRYFSPLCTLRSLLVHVSCDWVRELRDDPRARLPAARDVVPPVHLGVREKAQGARRCAFLICARTF
ncbi:hypothetical protein C8R45DRAFT_1113219 [Mycena sanguinolenta]|nr:hypothetical protein C8R45DRAFT_1113219 [Mycena sanguinolenta]